jgi:hypothetical protein
VLALVISTVGIVSVSGVSVLQDARDAEQMQTAQRAFDLLAENVADIHRQGAPSRSTEISLGDAQLVAAETTTFNVSWTNATGGREFQRIPTASVTYRTQGDQRLVYDAGAVFRLSEPDTGGVAVRDPPFLVTDRRAVIAVPQTFAATSSVSGSTVLVRTTRMSQTVLEHDAVYENVTVAVTSEHWQAWRDVLEDDSHVDCGDGDPATGVVRCDLGDPDVFYLTETQIRVELTR